MTHAQYRNCESGYSSEEQSSRLITHGLYACATDWQHIMCSGGHMGHDVASTKKALTDEALSPSFPT